MNERTNDLLWMMVVKVVVIRPKLIPEKKKIRGNLIF
jgi:hypothetical protein